MQDPQGTGQFNAEELVAATAAGDLLPTTERRQTIDRRTHSLRSFLFGSLRPRRRMGRRDGDDTRIFLDWHEPRVLYLSLSILLMSCMDAFLTLNIITGGGEELNGLMNWLIAADPVWFVGTKLAATGGGVIFLAIAVRRRFLGAVPVIRLLECFCVGYLLLMAWEIYLLSQMFPHLFARLL